MGERAVPFRTRARDILRDRIAVDARALAAFRIGLGTLLLADLLRRSGNLVAFYTDSGVVPRSALATQAPAFRHLSIHALSGSVWWQVTLFIIAGLAALSLLVGYRTTLATAISFVLLISLHARNPAILHGGDSLLRQLLLWAIFLPLGERWAVDAVHRDDRQARDRIVSLATAGLLLQVVIVYATNAVMKLRGDAWPDGMAVEYAFALTRHTSWAGEWIAQFPTVLTVANYFWLALLVVSPLLVVLTDWRRSALATAFVGCHAGLVVFMTLGTFPFISIVALLPFLHAGVWGRLSALSERQVEPLADVFPAWRLRSSTRGRLAVATRVLVAGLLVTMVLINGISLGLVQPPGDPPDSVTDKGWDMFAPRPPTEDSYYVVPATLESGERVDALREEPVTWQRPADVSDTFGNERWRKLLYQLDSDPERQLREPLAGYLCSRWNQRHDDRMTHLRLVYVLDPTDGGERERISYGAWNCTR